MRALLLAAALLVAGPATGVCGQAWDVALTFDDLPLTGGGGADCGAAEIMAVHDSLLAALGRRAILAAGFVVPGTPCQADGEAGALGITLRWRRAGHAIGNHSHTHPDYNAVTIGPYLADVQQADRVLAPLLRETGQSARWFRPPQLHAGSTPERRTALTRWLAENRYRMGSVTIDNQEWVFAAAYLTQRARGDSAAMKRIVDGYVAHLLESAAYYRALSRRLFGRDIPQVLLLHANRLNADHLERVLDALEHTSARFVSLADATSDPAYDSPEDYVGPRGLSWLQRWALARGVEPGPEPREPAWLQALTRR